MSGKPERQTSKGDNEKNKTKSASTKKRDEAEEAEEESFRRITDERKGKKGKTELELEWMDGTRSWVPREDLEGQDVLEEWDNQEPEEPEVICSDRELEEKVKRLAQWIKEGDEKNRCIVFHVGAGMSAGDGVPTFRGVGGLWTKGREDITNFDLTAVKPGPQYDAMVLLERKGLVDWVVTQNYDGLFRKSGYPKEKLSEVHGNIFIETCLKCGNEYERGFPVEKEDADGENHRTGRVCKCTGELVDNLVHFGEMLNHEAEACANSKKASISIAVGTKLMVTPAATWAFWPHKGAKSRRGKVVIMNPQVTPEDANADLVIHHKAEPFFRALLKALHIQ
jgi:mono-ADP-ribosyltransferase sirtuin 6